MDFCDNDTPWGHVSRARSVLDFVCQTLCWPVMGEQIELNTSQQSGLSVILMACSKTLQKAEEEAEEEDIRLAACNDTAQQHGIHDVHYL